MKKCSLLLLTGMILLIAISCTNSPTQSAPEETQEATVSNTGQSGVEDEESAKNVVQVAASSKDHTTLVAAVKAADLVNALSNAGPFTVFAPTNAAFDLLPAGTVEGLLKPESKDALANILQYHVSLGVFNPEAFQDGQTIGQVNGDNITMQKTADGITVNGKAKIVASIRASNGIIHVIDAVLLPPQ